MSLTRDHSGLREDGGRSSERRERGSTSSIAPSKVTRTSHLSMVASGAVVQRKETRPSSTIPIRSAAEWTMDPWMDAAVRGTTPAEMSGERHASGMRQGAVQMRGGQEQPASDVHQLAERGLSGAASSLPYLDQIQRSFGSHDVSGVKAHVGGPAAHAAEGMGASAYATGDHVAFREAPDLHTAAHEAAHVVQQRAGVQLEGGVGEVGDEHERQADAVADAVVRGESADTLLGVHDGGRNTINSNVQRAERGDEKKEEKPRLPSWNDNSGKNVHPPMQRPGAGSNKAAKRPGLNSPSMRVVQRFPSPPDAHVFRPGLSPIGAIYKNQYKGDASTTIETGWCMGSFERRWQLYDATDTLVDESFYTIPKPTYTIPARAVLAGRAGGSAKPWSVWIKVTKTLVPFGSDNPDNFPHSYVTFPVYNTAADETVERDTGEDEGFGVALPKGASPTRAANTNVSPDVALKIIENHAKGEHPFKPELGKGGASWFVTEGAPYTGIDPSKSIEVPVELVPTPGQLRFDEARLQEIYNEEVQRTSAEVEAKYREFKGLNKETPLNSKMRKGLQRFQERFAESRMWDRVGEMVRASEAKAGEVILQEGSRFSKTPGKFGVVADASKIRLKGGVGPLVETLDRAGVSVEPVVLEAVTKLSTKMKWAGRVRGAFRYGGRILLVLAIAQDVYKIYYAEDKLKAVITSLGGWAGATAAGAAFAAWFTPADTAGPLAWAAHGVGTLVAGGIGYWIGSETTRYIYELVPIGDGSTTDSH